MAETQASVPPSATNLVPKRKSKADAPMEAFPKNAAGSFSHRGPAATLLGRGE